MKGAKNVPSASTKRITSGMFRKPTSHVVKHPNANVPHTRPLLTAPTATRPSTQRFIHHANVKAAATPAPHASFAKKVDAQKTLTRRVLKSPTSTLPKITASRFNQQRQAIKSVVEGNIKKAHAIAQHNLAKKKAAIHEAVKTGAMSPEQAKQAERVVQHEAKKQEQTMTHAAIKHGKKMEAATKKDLATQTKDDYQKVIIAVNRQAENRLNEVDRRIRQIDFMRAQGKLSDKAADSLRKEMMALKQKIENDKKKKALALKKAYLEDMKKHGVISEKHPAFTHLKVQERKVQAREKILPATQNIQSKLFRLEHWIASYKSAIASAEQLGAKWVSIPIETKSEGVKEFRMSIVQAKKRLYTLIAQRDAELKRLEKMGGKPIPKVVVLDRKTGEPAPVTHVKQARDEAMARRDMKKAKLLTYALKHRHADQPKIMERTIKIYIDIHPYLKEDSMPGERVVSTTPGKARTPQKGVPRADVPSMPHAIVRSPTPPTNPFTKPEKAGTTHSLLTGKWSGRPPVKKIPSKKGEKKGVLARFLEEIKRVI